MAQFCLKLMSESFKSEMDKSELDSPVVESDDQEKRPSGALKYACQFWVYHLTRAVVSKDFANDLRTFACDVRVLCWIERMAILGHLDDVMQALYAVQPLLKVCSIVLSPI
jgi:hypothetical protein